jgi:hypothetical protein
LAKVTPTIDDREVIEYKVYMVLRSFVHALVRLVQLLPTVVDYDNAFLLSEFLPKLQAAVRDAGIRTKQHALLLLGELIYRPSTVPLPESSAIAEWCEMLAGFAVSDHESVRTLAVGFAARTLFLGFRDCEFLLTNCVKHI